MRSGIALGAFLGGPGPSWAEKWPGPWRGGDLASDQGEKWPEQPRNIRSPKPLAETFKLISPSR